jgi:hypothetical protein
VNEVETARKLEEILEFEDRHVIDEVFNEDNLEEGLKEEDKKNLN